MDRQDYDFDNTAKVDKWLLRGLVAIVFVMVGGCIVKEAAAHSIACDPADRITQWLADKYQEAPIATGQAGERTLVQLWLSEDGATFTIVTINTAGVACMLASGSHWTEQEFVAPEPGEES